MDWLIYERRNGQPITLIDGSHPDDLMPTIARAVVAAGSSDVSIALLDCNGDHPRRECPCVACEVARGSQAVILIGSA